MHGIYILVVCFIQFMYTYMCRTIEHMSNGTGIRISVYCCIEFVHVRIPIMNSRMLIIAGGLDHVRRQLKISAEDDVRRFMFS